MKLTMSMLALVLVLTLGLGCDSPPPKQADSTPNITGQTTFPPDLGRGAPRAETEVTMMYVPIEVQNVCEGRDPSFAFDSAHVRWNDAASLRNLAECMNVGALRGKSIRVVGYADVRGSEGYNERLGMKRAEAVKLTLMKNGISSERVEVATKGKDESSPPPKHWDRRVDIEMQ